MNRSRIIYVHSRGGVIVLRNSVHDNLLEGSVPRRSSNLSGHNAPILVTRRFLLSPLPIPSIFLNDLRESGDTNMLGATPYLAEEFEDDDMSMKQWREVLLFWMQNFDEIHRRLNE